MAKATLDWKNDGQDIDLENSGPAIKAQNEKRVAANATSRAETKALETLIRNGARDDKMITAEQDLAFGWNFGKCRVVVVPLEVQKAKGTKGLRLGARK
jgi:hypothetical protein